MSSVWERLFLALKKRCLRLLCITSNTRKRKTWKLKCHCNFSLKKRAFRISILKSFHDWVWTNLHLPSDSEISLMCISSDKHAFVWYFLWLVGAFFFGCFWLEEICYTERLELAFYSVQILATFRSRGKWDSDCLLIDGMVSQLGDQVEKLWRRDKGGTGKYPPASLHVSVTFTANNNKTSTKLHPKANDLGKARVLRNLLITFSFQALLDLYLLESVEESDKHAIVSFLVIFITPSVYAHKCS